MKDFNLRCIKCDCESDPAPDRYTCPECGSNMEVVLNIPELNHSVFPGPGRGIARFAALLPVDVDNLPPLPVGPTLLQPVPAIAKEWKLKSLYIKDDGRLPSASFKDRASAVALARGLEIGAKDICGASTGNAAAATACLGASAGVNPYIFVPKNAPSGKIAQLVIFGAKLFLVDGSYDDAFDLSLKATEEFGWYNRNTGFNPYTREGKKTVSFEILEDLHWKVPDWVIVAVGDGNIISGVHKGFRDAKSAGLIDRLPKLLAAQSEKSDSVTRAVNGDGTIRKVNATTLADSISVDLPRDGDAAVKAVKESGGAAITVTDEAILDAQREMASRTGIFAEPAAACAYAGAKKAVKAGVIKEGASAVIISTGNGLKDIKVISESLPNLPIVEPSIEALKKVLNA